MAAIARTLQKGRWGIYAALLILLGGLLVLSPAEATLGSVVKIVYLHGALERVAVLAYLLAGLLGVAHLFSQRAALVMPQKDPADVGNMFVRPDPNPGPPGWRFPNPSMLSFRISSKQRGTRRGSDEPDRLDGLARWSRAGAETAIAFWLAQFLVSLPAQILAWGRIVWTEPRVLNASWILLLTVLIYLVARWIDEAAWMSLSAAANAAVVIIVLRGAANVLHPFNPIVASDSIEIKLYYAAIVLVTAVSAFRVAQDCAERNPTSVTNSIHVKQPAIP